MSEMKALLAIGLVTILATEAVGTCVCVIGPIIIYPNLDALCLARRYETGDCEKGKPGQCQRPTNVKEFRKKGMYAAEYCPHCRPYGPRDATRAAAAPSDDEHAHEHEHSTDDNGDQGRPRPFPGLPVSADFDPQKEKVLPEGAEAKFLGFFSLQLGNKLATDIESENSVRVGKEIHVKLYAVSYPFVVEEQLIAFETRSKHDSSRVVSPGNITRVRFDPYLGKWAITLRAHDAGLREFADKSILVVHNPRASDD
jgi:hypothetical protein